MEQQLALIDLSQRLSALQAWAIGEVSWLESLAYFAIAVCTAYLTTAWSRAIEARGWIFALLFVGVLLEQGIFKILLAHFEGSSAMFHKVIFVSGFNSDGIILYFNSRKTYTFGFGSFDTWS